jgi:hypothetical protein
LTGAKSKLNADTALDRNLGDGVTQHFKGDLAVRVGVQEATGLRVGRAA